MPAILKPLSMARNYIAANVAEGDKVVDATAGNGYDSLFLARLVGHKGKVYAFDIQQEALENTRCRLERENVADRVQLIQSGHEHMLKYVNCKISAAMFNLGYLPGGDHSIVTQPDTTVKALKGCLQLLCPGGIVTIVIYSGHKGGREEKEELLDFCAQLNQEEFAVLHYAILNQINEPPFLLVVEKIL